MDSLLLTLLLACGVGPGAPAPAELPASPTSWAERFALVRADLDQLRAAHQAKDQASCLRQWDVAYEEHFEPLIEVPLAGSATGGAVLAAEYGFGRLRAALDSPRPGPAEEALAALSEALAGGESQAGALPPPTP